MVGGIVPALPPELTINRMWLLWTEIIEDLCLAADIAGPIKMSSELETSRNRHSLVFIYSFQAPMVSRETTAPQRKTSLPLPPTLKVIIRITLSEVCCSVKKIHVTFFFFF